MAQYIFYSILFFDDDCKHRHIDNDIMFCNSEKYLIKILALYDQVKLTVLDKLRQCSNIASIIMCTRQHIDHNEHNWTTNHRPIIKENLFEDPRQWNFEAHTDLLNANEQKEIINHIPNILRQLLKRDIFTCQTASEQ